MNRYTNNRAKNSSQGMSSDLLRQDPSTVVTPIALLSSSMAPLLRMRASPLAKSERTKAQASATFYSECVLNGIGTADADTAALEVNENYKRWWTDTSPSSAPKRSKADPLGGAVITQHDSAMTNVITEDHSIVASERDVNPADGHVASLERPMSDEVGRITRMKDEIISELQGTGGDTSTRSFLAKVEVLHAAYSNCERDVRWTDEGSAPVPLDGMWMALSRPSFPECKGRNDKGEYLYSLGRMSFDMFRPTNLECSIQVSRNTIRVGDAAGRYRPLYVPSSLRSEVYKKPGQPTMRNYDVSVAFTIEPNQTQAGQKFESGTDSRTQEYILRRPIRGLLTNFGYCLPDPRVANRLSVWFSGGSLEVQDPSDIPEWKQLFNESTAPRRDLKELARVLAARILLGAQLPEGMSEDGTMTYWLKRPIGGHGKAFCDVLYADETFRIIRGHRGSLFAFTRLTAIPPDEK